MFSDMTSWRLLSSRISTSFLSWPWLLLKNICGWERVYDLGLEGVAEAGAHVVVAGVEDLLVGVLFAEALADFLEEGEGGLVLVGGGGHADEEEDAVLVDVEVVSEWGLRYYPL